MRPSGFAHVFSLARVPFFRWWCTSGERSQASVMRISNRFLGISSAGVGVAVLLASNGVINVTSRNQVSHEGTNGKELMGYRWEPSTAAGSTWATSWATYPVGNTSAVTSYVSGWNGIWLGPVKLTTPTNLQTADVNLSWDSVRNRFVFALLGVSTTSNPTIWYGYSTDSTGSQWAFGNKNSQGVSQPVFVVTSGDWDYPSIGVDASGRVIIGGVDFLPVGFYAAVSSDGEHFGTPHALPLSGSGVDLGIRSRVVAAGSTFHAFVPTLNSQFLPTAVSRYQSPDGVTWSGPFAVESFAPPLNSAQPSGSNLQIFYAPYLSAAGYTDGRWIVGFQRNVTGWNNMDICTSDRGCGTVNSAADDQFLAGVSVSADGYWAAYHTYSTINNRSLPVITQAIYFKTGASGVGATTNPNIGITSWVIAGIPGQSPGGRCTSECYAAGDFNTPSSNKFAMSHTPLCADQLQSR